MISPANLHIANRRGSGSGQVDTPLFRRILADSFPKQREFVLYGDIAIAGRGAGKSGGAAIKFHRPAATHPGCSSVFVTQSAERSRDILLPALLRMNEAYNLGLREYKGGKALIWPNGYKLLFRGCKDRNEANKRRGTPWVTAGWDECDAMSSTLLEYDITECVEPRLADFRGKWFASGTPGPIPQGYWHKLSSGANKALRVIHWDARENPFMFDPEAYFLSALRKMIGLDENEDLFRGLCAGLCTNGMPDGLETPRHFFLEEFLYLLPPKFVREYLGKWAQDIASLCYRLSQVNGFAGQVPVKAERTTIGLDLGGASVENPHLDHCAISVAQSTPLRPTVWVPESFKVSDATPQSLAARCLRLVDTYGGDAIVYVDSASAGKLIETQFRRMGLAVKGAIKGPKKPRIQMVQHVLACGDLKLSYAGTIALREEAEVLVWNDQHTDHHPKCADDAWDSLLYAVIPHLADYDPEEEPPEPGTREFKLAEEQAEIDEAFDEACRELDESGL